MIHERVAMTFFRKMGLNAPREASTRLFINDQYAGVYTIVEYVDPVFLQNHFGESEGDLYAYEYINPWVFQYLGPETSAYSPEPYKPETNLTNYDPTPIVAMARTLNQAPDAQLSTALSQYIDLPNLFKELAAENFVSEQDGIIGDYGVNNHFLYRFENSFRSIFIPWDKSNTFWSQDWDILHNFSSFVLTIRAMSIAPDLMALYESALQQAAAIAGGAGGWMEQEITKEYQQIRQAAYLDTLKLQDPGATGFLRPASNADFDAENQYMIQFARTRSDLVTSELNSRFNPAYTGFPAPAVGTQASAQPIDEPTSVVPDGAGGFYVVGRLQNRIYKVAADGTITSIAGNSVLGFSGDGGPAKSAELALPSGIALDASGNLYIADYGNNRVRKVTPAGVISTVAGNGVNGFSGDGGPATSAQLWGPAGVAVDNAGNLYIADITNYRVRMVSNGVITTVAGNGSGGFFSGDGGPATSAAIFSAIILKVDAVDNLAVDAAGNIFIPDFGNNRVRKVSPVGVITTVAGTGVGDFGGDGAAATSALLHGPVGVAVDAAGDLFIADSINNRIRKVTPSGVISTVAGNGTFGFAGDGGAATAAQLAYPDSVTLDAAGNLYIADSGNNRVRKVTPAGVITTVAGNGASGY